MITICLNGEEFHTVSELHKVLKTKFALPDYYGENLDALWDCLTTDITLPISLCWVNFNKSRECLGNYAVSLLDLLIDVSNYHGDAFKFTYIY
ncbi:barstar family protein [Clostridium polynesiense]|uniref:barstar family protein n=1 Tax=Clostridium polynesiense TaxID=1325933 RepID=UPI000694A711|nr:barstar family protein [Clostridium polynesiense]